MYLRISNQSILYYSKHLDERLQAIWTFIETIKFKFMQVLNVVKQGPITVEQIKIPFLELEQEIEMLQLNQLTLA